MKKTFSGGKIWTLLSALIFLMTCGVFVVYAQSSGSSGIFDRWKTSSMGPVLAENDWNDLMDSLDKYALFPTGAIVAFAAEECPDGWSRYFMADGKTLRGKGVSPYGTYGGSDRAYLKTGNIPSHDHLIRIGDVSHIGDNNHTLTVPVDWKTGNPVSDYFCDKNNCEVSKNGTGRVISTSEFGKYSPDPIDITNPYVNVLFCIKNEISGPSYYSVSFNVNSNSGQVIPSIITGVAGAPISTGQSNVQVGAKAASVQGKVYVSSDPFIGRITYEAYGWGNGTCGAYLTGNCTLKPSFRVKQHDFYVNSENNSYVNECLMNLYGGDLERIDECMLMACNNYGLVEGYYGHPKKCNYLDGANIGDYNCLCYRENG